MKVIYLKCLQHIFELQCDLHVCLYLEVIFFTAAIETFLEFK